MTNNFLVKAKTCDIIKMSDNMLDSKKENIIDNGADLSFDGKIFAQLLDFAEKTAKIEEIIDKNPGIAEDELMEKIGNFNLKEKQKEYFKIGARGFLGRMSKVKEITSGIPENEKEKQGEFLYKKIFKKPPNQSVKFISDNANIILICENDEDFRYALYHKEIVKNGLNKIPEESAEAAYLPEIKDYPAIVIAVNKELIDKNNHDISSAVRHEKQHAYNSLFYRPAYEKEKVILEDIKNMMRGQENGDKISWFEKLKIFLKKYERYATEGTIKEEAIAYFCEPIPIELAAKKIISESYNLMPQIIRHFKLLREEETRSLHSNKNAVFKMTEIISQCGIFSKKFEEKTFLALQCLDLFKQCKIDKKNFPILIVQPLEQWDNIVKKLAFLSGIEKKSYNIIKELQSVKFFIYRNYINFPEETFGRKQTPVIIAERHKICRAVEKLIDSEIKKITEKPALANDEKFLKRVKEIKNDFSENLNF